MCGAYLRPSAEIVRSAFAAPSRVPFFRAGLAAALAFDHIPLDASLPFAFALLLAGDCKLHALLAPVVAAIRTCVFAHR